MRSGHSERWLAYSAMSRLTGLIGLMLQATCHGTRADDPQRVLFAMARFANNEINQRSRRHLL
jgi:hypothetical protein